MGTAFFLLLVGLGLYILVKAVGNSEEAESKPLESSPFRVVVSGPSNTSVTTLSSQADKPKGPIGRWIPPGEEVSVQGFAFPSGGLYVGAHLGERRNFDHEPALIRPALTVTPKPPGYHDSSAGYWPSYSNLSPGCRGAFLAWLKSGRRDPSAEITYVFVYYYGLERRFFVDAATDPEAAADRPWILEEVNSLLEVYGDNGSFRGYATGFLDCGSLALKERADDLSLYQPSHERRWDFPFGLKIALGRLIREGQPIPAPLALDWAWRQPELKVRTPATRCWEELVKLFELKYQEQFGDGLVLKPNKRKLKAEYRTASASIRSPISIDCGDIPDVSGLKAPVKKLKAIFESCQEALDPFSRWLGRNKDGRGTIAALAYLPKALTALYADESTGGLKSWLEGMISSEQPVCIGASDLLDRVSALGPADPAARWRKRDGTTLAQLLERLGYGLEPDVRFGGTCPDRTEWVALFSLGEEAMTAPGEAYGAAMLTLHLGAAVAVADGVVTQHEERRLLDQLERSLDLTAEEKRRLRTHLAWLLRAHPGHRGLKKRLSGLDEAGRDALGALLLAVASEDGRIDAAEMSTLEKLFKSLGLPKEQLYSRAHHSLAQAPATEPVLVREGDTQLQDFAIPEPPRAGDEVPKPDSPKGLDLDMALVQAKLRETHAVSSLLGSIFDDEEDEAIEEPGNQSLAAPGDDLIPGLDALHSTLLRRLALKPQWSRDELEEVCDELGLMADGALEALNEAAFDTCGDPLLEEGDPIEIDPEILEEMMP